MSRTSFLLACALVIPRLTSAQEADYSEDRIAPSRVPVPFLKAAQKEAPGLRFSLVYKDNEKDYRLVAKGPDGKTTAVKLDREGKLLWKRVYTDVPAARLPKAVASALQDQIKTNAELAGFQVARTSLVDLTDAKGASTYYEFFGKTPPPRFPRVEIDPSGKALRVDMSYLPNTGDYTRRESLAPNAVPPEVRRGVAEAVPGIKLLAVLRATTKDNPTPTYEAFGRTAKGRGAEVWTTAGGAVNLAAVSVPLREVPRAALDAIVVASKDETRLEGFRPSEARQLRLFAFEAESLYEFFGDDKDGEPVQVRVKADGKVDVQGDSREVYREEAGIGSPEPRPKDAVAPRGFSVIAVRYGRLDRWLDVTEEVREALDAGKKEFRADALPDPFYGSHKSFVMVYAMDGKVGISDAQDDRPLPLDIRQDESTLAAIPPRGFAVLAARFGIEEKWEDATQAVRAKVSNGRLEFRPMDGGLPDPAVGVAKMLAIAYSVDGKVGLVVNHEARGFNLPPEGPPVNGESLLTRSIEFPKNPYSPTFTGDGKQVVVGVDDGSVRMLDANTGRELHRFDGHGDGAVPATVSATGAVVVSGGADKVVRVWDVKAGREKVAMRGHTEAIVGVALSPNGRQVASTSRDKTVRLWDVASGREVRRFEGHTDLVPNVKFTPDGRQLVTAGWDRTMRVWDVNTGKELRKLEAPEAESFCGFALSRDGKQVFFGSKHGEFRVWEPSSGKEPTVFRAYAECEWCVALLPDGHRVLFGDFHAASLWDTKNARPGLRLERHLGRVSGVAVSPDGKRVATCAEDHTLKFWKLPDLGR